LGQVKINFAMASQSRQAINEFHQSKPLHSGYNQLPSSIHYSKQLPPFQAILVRQKPTSFFPSHSSHTKKEFLYSKPFLERPKLTSDIPSQFVFSATD
jgi:hypothetical protein